MRQRAFLASLLLVAVAACSDGTSATSASGTTETSAVVNSEEPVEETGSSVTVSEDCETNIAAMQALVDEGGTFNDLTGTAQEEAAELISAVTNTCLSDRRREFSEQPDVAAWLVR